MKAEIHPDYHEITVVMTDGTEYKTRSTYGKEGDVLTLDVDPLTHPAWQGGTGKVIEKGQLDKFESRYGSFMSGDAPSKEEVKEMQKQAEEAQAETEKKAQEAGEAAAAEAAAEAEQQAEAALAGDDTAETQEEDKKDEE